MSKEGVQRIDKVWHSRSPVHELNADSGEDMFYGTMRIAMSEYAQQEAIAFAGWAAKHYVKIDKDDEGNEWIEKLLGRYHTSEQLYNLFKQKQ
jgi:hypothetical protein